MLYSAWICFRQCDVWVCDSKSDSVELMCEALAVMETQEQPMRSFTEGLPAGSWCFFGDLSKGNDTGLSGGQGDLEPRTWYLLWLWQLQCWDMLFHFGEGGEEAEKELRFLLVYY